MKDYIILLRLNEGDDEKVEIPRLTLKFLVKQLQKKTAYKISGKDYEVITSQINE